MPPNKDLNDWLGDLRWQGYPRLEPIRDTASRVEAEPEPAPKGRTVTTARVEALARENEGLRAKIETLAGLVTEFERRLSRSEERRVGKECRL